MKDGTRLHVQIVKMNGHTMVAIPMAELPDYLHQQIFSERPIVDHDAKAGWMQPDERRMACY